MHAPMHQALQAQRSPVLCCAIVIVTSPEGESVLIEGGCWGAELRYAGDSRRGLAAAARGSARAAGSNAVTSSFTLCASPGRQSPVKGSASGRDTTSAVAGGTTIPPTAARAEAVALAEQVRPPTLTAACGKGRRRQGNSQERLLLLQHLGCCVMLGTLPKLNITVRGKHVRTAKGLHCPEPGLHPAV